MKRTAPILVLLLAATPLFAKTKERVQLHCPLLDAQTTVLPQGVTTPWPKGEKLEFTLSWGPVAVGRADLWSKETVVTSTGTLMYHIVSTARSNAFTDAFFKVRDVNESWIDVSSLTSHGYIQVMREGGFIWDEWMTFDTATRRFDGLNEDRGGNVEQMHGEIPGPIHDILSALYYSRRQKLEVGKEFVIDVNSRKNWPLVVKITGTDTVKAAGQTYNCFIAEPQMREKGLFVQKGKRLRVWLADDKYHTPVMLKAEVFIGHITGKLAKITRD
jgi:hypothetical protein